jgi:hypothetical protein
VDRDTAGELTNRPNAQEEFGFTTPRFTILLQGSGPDRRLEIGNLGAYNDRLSLQIVGNNTIYQTLPDILRLLPTNKNDWRDRSLLSLSNLVFQTLRVRSVGNDSIAKDFVLERDATNHLWFMRKPFTSRARADTGKPDETKMDLDAFGLQSSETTPELALSFLDRSNIVAGLQMGHSLTNYTNYAFARRDDPSNIVVVAKEPFKPWLAPYTNFLDQHFISLSPSLIESIKVKGGDDFEVRKTNGQWMVVAGQTFPADALLMEYWLASFTNAPTEIAKTVVTDFSTYGLSNSCLQYSLRFSPEAGAPNETHLDFGTNAAGKVFERCEEEEGVNAVKPADFELLPRFSWQLRDRQVWQFEASNVVTINIHQQGGTLEYRRDLDGNWTYAPGYSSQIPLNSTGIEECLLRIGHLRAIYWDGVGDETTNRFGFAQADYTVDFKFQHGGTNETLRLQFGTNSPYFHPYASVVRDGQRLVFEFPAGLYGTLVQSNLTVISARLHYH